MTNPNSIQSVPLDYFMGDVSAAPPPENQVPAGNAEALREGAAPEQPPRAGELIRQLDVLLIKAAQASTKSLDGKAVKTSLQKLVDDGALSRNSLKLLSKTADTAEAALKKLNGFTGRQLAGAFNDKGEFDAGSAAGKAIREAITAQNALSDMLAQLDKQLDSIARHAEDMRAANPGFKGVDAALQNEVNEMRQLCDRRSTEIMRLAYQMRDFALKQAAGGQEADPNITAILKAKVSDLLPRTALAMHGTADALASVNERVTAQLKPLAQRIEAFKADPKATISDENFLTLQGDINKMKSAIEDIRRNGVEVGGGRMMVAKDVIEALEKGLQKAEDLFKTARQDVMTRVCVNFLTTAERLLCPDERYENEVRMQYDGIQELFDLRDSVLHSMEELVLEACKTDASGQRLNELLTNLLQQANHLTNAALSIDRFNEPSAAKLNDLVGRLGGIGSVVLGLAGIIHSMRKGDAFVTGAEAMSLFTGKLTVSSVLECRVRGLDASDVNQANEDPEIVSKKKLGQGASGAVYELKRSDGKSVIFKGEIESRTGLSKIAAGSGRAYEHAQQVVNLNLAAKKTAEALGMGGLVVDYSIGTHRGVFGFFMEKAKGLSGRSLLWNTSSQSPDAGLSAKEIKRLPPAQKQQVAAAIKRELNRLHWSDLVTGQMDRHWENYFIHVDPVTLKVTVKGIDNDAAFSQYRTGAVKFSLDKDRTLVFKAELRDIARSIDSRHVEQELSRLLSDPGITVGDNGNITIDASKIKNKAIGFAVAKLLGTQSLAVPDKIDRETYNSLIALKSDPARKNYLDSIRTRLSKANFDATVSRLDDVIAHAERLARENKIIENEPDGWLQAEEEPLATGKIPVEKQNGQVKNLGGMTASKANQAFCPSYYARDGFDKLFQ